MRNLMGQGSLPFKTSNQSAEGNIIYADFAQKTHGGQASPRHGNGGIVF